MAFGSIPIDLGFERCNVDLHLHHSNLICEARFGLLTFGFRL